MTRTIGIMGSGEMGSAVGHVLGQAGYRVVTALDGRSQTSRRLAQEAGLEDLGPLERVLEHCELFLSILPPAAATAFAREASAIVAATGREIVYADCNAVAPGTVAAIESLFAEGPARFVDVGIVGPAPRRGRSQPTRFYASGRDRLAILSLDVPEILSIDAGAAVGRASAIKMCYAAMNKGVDALYANLLLAARRLGVDALLMDELEASQPEAAGRMARRMPGLAATAERFAGEMAEIALTFDSAGVSGDFYRGAGWLYALLARSPLANETRATVPGDRTLEEAIAIFAAELED